MGLGSSGFGCLVEVPEGQRVGRREIGGNPFLIPLHLLAPSYSAFIGSEQWNSAYILDQVEDL